METKERQTKEMDEIRYFFEGFEEAIAGLSVALESFPASFSKKHMATLKSTLTCLTGLSRLRASIESALLSSAEERQKAGQEEARERLVIFKNFQHLGKKSKEKFFNGREDVTTHDLEWGEDMIRGTVEYELATLLLEKVDNGETLEEIREFLIRKLTSGAQALSSTSSPMHNLINELTAKVVARILDRI